MLTINKNNGYINKQTLVDHLEYNSKSTAKFSSIKSIKDLREEANNEFKVSKIYLYKIFD